MPLPLDPEPTFEQIDHVGQLDPEIGLVDVERVLDAAHLEPVRDSAHERFEVVRLLVDSNDDAFRNRRAVEGARAELLARRMGRPGQELADDVGPRLEERREHVLVRTRRPEDQGEGRFLVL
jgi:hypothetical protein